ncbi:hypothetical protein ACFQ61_12085 [Streptomyces sp. NPDC056500]|uniref:hypothetical protein n=1 Tax=Streptomyces sp. NPDC056500 TaxID=3345840 RepID=UPI0036C020D9
MPRPDTEHPRTEESQAPQEISEPNEINETDIATVADDARPDEGPPGRSRCAPAVCSPSASRVVHGFRPGRLLAGLTALTLTLLYAGDAAGAWHVPWFVVFPVITGGLSIAGMAGFVHYGLRRRRANTAASSESTDAPASTRGNQAIR